MALALGLAGRHRLAMLLGVLSLAWLWAWSFDFTADVLARRGINRILLATSALHMPRSLALFEAQGLEVIPAATDHEVTPLPGWRKWLPDTGALDGSSRAIKEIVGRLVGR